MNRDINSIYKWEIRWRKSDTKKHYIFTTYNKNFRNHKIKLDIIVFLIRKTSKKLTSSFKILKYLTIWHQNSVLKRLKILWLFLETLMNIKRRKDREKFVNMSVLKEKVLKSFMKKRKGNFFIRIAQIVWNYQIWNKKGKNKYISFLALKQWC